MTLGPAGAVAQPAHSIVATAVTLHPPRITTSGILGYRQSDEGRPGAIRVE
jgi:hypothetical protein